MNYYSVYGLLIASEIVLDVWERNTTSDHNADVQIVLGDVPAQLDDVRFAGANFHVTPNASRVHIPNMATFHITDGDRITIQSTATPDAYAPFLIYDVLPIIFHQRGVIALRGAAIQTEHGAILLLGRSGGGKSTITTAMIQAGHTLLSDDLSVIEYDPNSDQYIVQAGFPYIPLWRYALASLNIDLEATLRRVREGLQRFYYPIADDHFQLEARPIVKAYLINYHNQEELATEAVRGVRKFSVLRRNIMQGRYLLDTEQAPTYLQQLWALGDRLPITTVTQPVNFFADPQTIATALLNDLASTRKMPS